jgi:hypothetical protein
MVIRNTAFGAAAIAAFMLVVSSASATRAAGVGASAYRCARRGFQLDRDRAVLRMGPARMVRHMAQLPLLRLRPR